MQFTRLVIQSASRVYACMRAYRAGVFFGFEVAAYDGNEKFRLALRELYRLTYTHKCVQPRAIFEKLIGVYECGRNPLFYGLLVAH